MKKKDLKKMALMGITGGVMLAAQSAVAGGYYSNYGGSYQNGCGGSSMSYGSGGYYQNSNRGNRGYYGSGYQNGCGGQSGYAGTGYYGSATQNGCGGTSGYAGTGYYGSATQNGCGGYSHGGYMTADNYPQGTSQYSTTNPSYAPQGTYQDPSMNRGSVSQQGGYSSTSRSYNPSTTRNPNAPEGGLDEGSLDEGDNNNDNNSSSNQRTTTQPYGQTTFKDNANKRGGLER